MKVRNARDEIVAMIPARMGSTRLAMKNLALVAGKPLIYYAIRAAKDSGIFKRIVINAEDEIFAEIAKENGVEFYPRTARLASSAAKSDSVVYDFMKHIPSDIVAWVNTIAPLQTAAEIRGAIEHFVKNRLDSMISVKNEQVHCLYKKRPVNFRFDGLFARTQDLIPVQPFVYSTMAWRSKVFIKEFENKGYAFFCGKKGVYPVSKLSSIIVKNEEDLKLADAVMRLQRKKFIVRYAKTKRGPKR